jgi:tRNA nucleotidyltransferase (CCA-adding enzyme)
MTELAAALQRWQYTGRPVLTDSRLVGIVSRRDLERTLKAHRSAENVAHYMSQPVRTTEEGALLEDALASMASADIGRW